MPMALVDAAGAVSREAGASIEVDVSLTEEPPAPESLMQMALVGEAEAVSGGAGVSIEIDFLLKGRGGLVHQFCRRSW